MFATPSHAKTSSGTDTGGGCPLSSCMKIPHSASHCDLLLALWEFANGFPLQPRCRHYVSRLRPTGLAVLPGFGNTVPRIESPAGRARPYQSSPRKPLADANMRSPNIVIAKRPPGRTVRLTGRIWLVVLADLPLIRWLLCDCLSPSRRSEQTDPIAIVHEPRICG